jgi:hypothetical protein
VGDLESKICGADRSMQQEWPGTLATGFASGWKDLEGTVPLFQIPESGDERVDLFTCVV